MLPRDLPLLKQLDQRLTQNPNNSQLKQDFDECLLKSCCTELLQVREYKVDPKTQKRYLEVFRACNTGNDNQEGSAAVDAQGNETVVAKKDQSEGPQGLASGYLFMSTFNLKKLVF